MSWNILVFVVFPYVAVALAFAVTALRAWWLPSTLTSRTSQLLEDRKLLWGSVPFHWGLSLTLAGHFLGLLIPRGLEAWNSVPLRLFVQEATAFGLGVWTLGGLAVLVWRRTTDARVRKVTNAMDLVVLGLLAVSVITGLSAHLSLRVLLVSVGLHAVPALAPRPLPPARARSRPALALEAPRPGLLRTPLRLPVLSSGPRGHRPLRLPCSTLANRPLEPAACAAAGDGEVETCLSKPRSKSL
jgi:hypothetical protein